MRAGTQGSVLLLFYIRIRAPAAYIPARLNVDEGYTTRGASAASAMSVLLLVVGSREMILRPESCLSPVITVVLGASTVGT